MPEKLLFLPGALGKSQAWEAIANLLKNSADTEHLGWPGFGAVPADPMVNSLEDLAKNTAAKIDRPTALLAQSMGGVIALRVAFAKPQWITHLVLAVTSGGVDVMKLGGQDWRTPLRVANPELPPWFIDDQNDLSEQIKTLQVPVLLLWGDVDPISPIAVGNYLHSLFPRAQLYVAKDGKHDLIETHADELAPVIDKFLL